MPHAQTIRLAILISAFCIQANAGYTHYFTWLQKPDEVSLSQCIGEMHLIVAARRTILAGEDGEGAPLVEAQQLVFNGIGDDGHEPFIFPGVLERTPPDPKIPAGFNGCKTAGKPYDEVVTACLLVARDHFPSSVLRLRSDGSWQGGDWRAGAALYSSVLHRPANYPLDGPDEPGSAAAQGVISPITLFAVVLSVFVVARLTKKARV